MAGRGEEFDYSLTFPGATTAGASNQTQQQQQPQSNSSAGSIRSLEDFVFVYEEQKRPLVVLLGWAGCQDKYLAKYSAIYEERSCITLRCTAPVEYVFWRHDRLPRISRRLIQLIRENRLDEHPVFFHLFSNGGAIFYQHISRAMQQAGSPLKIKGVIFDSSPGENRITSLFKAMKAIIGGHPLTSVPLSFMVTLFFSFFWIFEALIARALVKKDFVKTDPTLLMEEPYSWPQIFLYSNSDTLVHASDIEKFASRRAERGVRAQLVQFTDSPHVKHYTTYRDVYVSTVCGFINDCLRDNSPRSSELDTPLYLTKRIVLPHEAIKQP